MKQKGKHISWKQLQFFCLLFFFFILLSLLISPFRGSRRMTGLEGWTPLHLSRSTASTQTGQEAGNWSCPYLTYCVSTGHKPSDLFLVLLITPKDSRLEREGVVYFALRRNPPSRSIYQSVGSWSALAQSQAQKTQGRGTSCEFSGGEGIT